MSSLPIKITGTVVWATFSVVIASADAQVIWDRAQIDKVRLEKPANDTPQGLAVSRLKKMADMALELPEISVTHKDIVPPSGDLHDYLSFSRYWWPDPDKPDGLPYLRKDGVVNRKLIANGDRNRLREFCNAVQSLALAGYIFDEPEYSQHAAKMVRTWFLDESTRMNPNVNFGQGVPGRETGRGPGIIDTRAFMLVLDSVELFDQKTWSPEDQRGLQAWFNDFQQWLNDSPLGQHEQKAKNNHGSWYAAQRSRYALFAGQEELAKEIVSDAKERIAMQFDADGNQAAELERTLSLHYSLFNITALSRLARVGDQVGEDLWDFTPESGSSLHTALDHLLPYMEGKEEWQHEQIDPFAISPSGHLTLRLFSRHFDDDSYRDAAEKIQFRHAEQDLSTILVGDSRKSN